MFSFACSAPTPKECGDEKDVWQGQHPVVNGWDCDDDSAAMQHAVCPCHGSQGVRLSQPTSPIPAKAANSSGSTLTPYTFRRVSAPTLDV